MKKIPNFKEDRVGMKIIPSKTLEDNEIIPYPVECLRDGTLPSGFYVSLKIYDGIKQLPNLTEEYYEKD